ncbi:MAG: hypothetical protein SPL73_05435 [Cyanobacteriota bacterium]|nr:hypothetical protein [Cyanobacteriota bacterium]MDY6357987.1 hypothetical protein [Cyanobacteriota bacterium]MDY6364313.1 hypothetical protein [Cyanobacteriota bacterium]MDY6383619.1 hypothetical protein [Cyanobacteriota bacterium]
MRELMSENGIGSRVCSAITYLTAGFGGIVIFILLYFAKIRQSKFFQFNLYQSIFVSFAVFTLCMGYNIIYSILTKIPIIQILMSFIDFVINKPFILGYSLFQLLFVIYMIYVVSFSLLAKYPVIYKISSLIEGAVR